MCDFALNEMDSAHLAKETMQGFEYVNLLYSLHQIYTLCCLTYLQLHFTFLISRGLQ